MSFILNDCKERSPQLVSEKADLEWGWEFGVWHESELQEILHAYGNTTQEAPGSQDMVFEREDLKRLQGRVRSE